ncbi:MAG: flagellar biosynthesis anti-sigma factor FlgM [Epsilonproteobacteria bacterium]|nr:flagellar biosynthesis anti-sigma factor FlgM [Campylobacterota bacterium]
MISKVGAGVAAYLQQTQKTKDGKGLAPVKQSKELGKTDIIKEQIKNGEYKLDTQKTVRAILEELI